MKKAFAVFSLFVLAFTNVARADIKITSFGTGNFIVDTGGSTFSSGTQTATSYLIGGNDGGSSIYGMLPSPVNIAGRDSLTLILTAKFVGTATSDFQIDLLDSVGNERLYKGNFADFRPQNTELRLALSFVTQSGDFDNNVVQVGLLTAGTGVNSDVNLTMTSLDFSTVPEPGTLGLCGLGLAFLATSLRGIRFSRSQT